jgi:hypothetical protein
MSYLFNNDFLITEQGKINRHYIKKAARARARSRYGATCTRFDIAEFEERLGALAILQQAKFRDGLFIPSEPRHSEVA